MVLFTCHLALSVLNVKTAFRPPIPVYVALLKVLFLVLLFFMYITALSKHISSLSLKKNHLCADYTQLFSLSIHLIIIQISLTFKTFYNIAYLLLLTS